MQRIEAAYHEILAHGCMPLTLGGDHTLTLPVLRAVARRHGPVGLIHVDAHSDTNEEMFGEQLAHGTTFRRAFEEGCWHPKSGADWPARQRLCGGRLRLVTPPGLPRGAGRGLLAPIADAADGGDPRTDGRCAGLPQLRYRRTGSGLRTGTGTPEVGGLSVWQGLEIVRGCHGLNLVGGDVVEVSPPYDRSGNTALLAANLLFEMLCVLPAR